MSKLILSIPRELVLLSLVVSVTACAGAELRGRSAPQSEGKLITAEMIEKSGAATAWDALRRSGTHLSFRENMRGEPTSLTYRGRSSIYLSSAPLVMLDGIRVSNYTVLRDVPAQTVALIRILTGVDGTKYYGTGGGNGVILVQTKKSMSS